MPPLSAHQGHVAVPSQTDRRGAASDSNLRTLATLINRDVTTVTGGHDDLVEKLIAAAITSFVSEQGAARPAATRVAPLVWELGERHVCYGLGSEMLDLGFQHARSAAQRGIQVIVGLPGIGEHWLRRDLASYVELLHRHAVTAWERGQAMLNADDRRRVSLGAVLLNSTQRPPTDRLLRKAGLDPEADYVLLVSTAEEMPPAVFSSADVLAGPHAHEALVPSAQVQRILAHSAPQQVVAGPSTPLRAVSETAETVRRGAHLLRTGRALDQRSFVPCVDLLSVLVTDGLPGLSSLLATKHLAPMETLGSRRRIRDGELLLRWLELGQPLNQVARSLGIPPQTAHHRLNHLRGLLGAALDDPNQRVELIVALQGALPRWRREG